MKFIMFMVDKIQKNVLGENLEECSKDPLTGWFRDGCCNTDSSDRGPIQCALLLTRHS